MKFMLSKLVSHKLFKVLSWGTLTMFLTFIQGVMIARFYGPELRGFVAVPIVFLALSLPFTSLGLKQSTSYFFSKFNMFFSEKIKAKIYLSVLLTSLVTLSLFFLSEPSYQYYLLPISVFFLLKVLTEVNSYKFLATKNVHILNKYNFFRVLVELVLILALHVGEFNKYLVLYCFMGGALVHFILVLKFQPVNFLKVRREKSPANVSINFRGLVKKGLAFAIPLTFIGLNLSFDILMLSSMKSLNSVGIYQVAISIANLLWVVPTLIIPYLFSNALYTNLSDIAVKLKKLIAVIIVTAPVSFLVPLFSREFFIVIYGPDFVDSAEVFNIIVWGFYLMLIYKLVNPFLAGNGYTKVPAIIFVGGFMVNVTLNSILIPQLDYFGAALATLVSYTICSLAFVLYTYRLLGINKERKIATD